MVASFSPIPHIGHNIARLRNLRGIKQAALAHEIGLSQQDVSKMENSRMVEKGLLVKVAHALKLKPEIIEKFDETVAVYAIDNKLENIEVNDSGYEIHQVIDPFEKIIELYERLLSCEREKIELVRNQKKS